MAYCGPRGIPLSTFLGWSQADQDAALAWQADQAQRCPRCGTHEDEDPGEAVKHVCRGCARTSAASDTIKAEHRGFTTVRLRPYDD